MRHKIMSEEALKQLEALVVRSDRLLKFAWFIGAAIAMVAIWVANQNFTNAAQDTRGLENRTKIEKLDDLTREISTTLGRMDERLANIERTISK